MLKISDLTTHYGNSQALFGVDLEFGTGEVATLLGRNGMGKTTTINSIMGIVPPSAGSILFDGNELVGSPSFKTANLGIGLVPGRAADIPQSEPVGEPCRNRQQPSWRTGSLVGRTGVRSVSRTWRTAQLDGAICFRGVSSRCWRSDGL